MKKLFSNGFVEHSPTPAWHGSRSSPGDPENVFRIKNDKVVFKKFLLAEHQSLATEQECIVDVRPDVLTWIQEHPSTMWRQFSGFNDCHFAMTRTIVDRRLYTLMAMRWSD